MRLGFSPDDADAFALTFAQPVTAGPRGLYDRTSEDYERMQRARRRPGFTIHDYDPLDEEDDE